MQFWNPKSTQRQTQVGRFRFNPSRYHPFVRPTVKQGTPTPVPSSQSLPSQQSQARVDEIDEDDESILSVIKRETQAESSCNTTLSSEPTQESCESTEEESLLHIIKRETQAESITQHAEPPSQETEESDFKSPCNNESDESLLATIKRETQNSDESQIVKSEINDDSVIGKIIQDSQAQSTQHSMCLFSQY